MYLSLFTKELSLRLLQIETICRQQDNYHNATQKLKSVWERIENIVAKVENAGHQHFLIFLQCF